jgi:hypothetical protein
MALTPDELAEMFARAWQPGEREEAIRALDERRARRQAGDDGDELQAPGPAHAPVIRKGRHGGEPKKPRASAAPTQPDWRRWIDRRLARAIDRNERATIAGFADVLGEQLAARDKLIAELRATIETLADRLDEIEQARQVPKVASPVALVG